MKTSDTISEIAKALSLFQENALVLGKNSKGYGYTYVSLDKIVSRCYPILAQCGLSISHVLSSNGDIPVLCTILMHSSGEFISGAYPLEKVGLKQANDAQQYGAAIAYAQRYATVAILGLATSDDDAQCLTRDQKHEDDSEQICIEIGKKILKISGSSSPQCIEARRIHADKSMPPSAKIPLMQELLDQVEQAAEEADA